MPVDTQESPDDLQQHDTPVAPQEAQSPPPSGDASPEGEHQEQQQAPGESDSQANEPHPLDPDGKRFKQVWARTKAAEAKVDTLASELQREREERIRMEERLKVKEEQRTQEREYSWDELEQAIEQGKVTRAWAQNYREGLVAKKATEAALKTVKEQQTTGSYETTINTELNRYRQAMPSIDDPSSAERQKVQREYSYLTGTLKYPPNLQTQLLAARSALGDIDTVERTAATKRTAHTTRESYMETQSTANRPAAPSKDPIAKLTPAEKQHYEKMIANGRYSGWDAVKKELEWVKPSLAPKRR